MAYKTQQNSRENKIKKLDSWLTMQSETERHTFQRLGYVLLEFNAIHYLITGLNAYALCNLGLREVGHAHSLTFNPSFRACIDQMKFIVGQVEGIEIKGLNSIYNRLKKLGERRNELAHAVDLNELFNEAEPFMVGLWKGGKTQKMVSMEKRELSPVDLDDFYRKVVDLKFEILQYIKRVR